MRLILTLTTSFLLTQSGFAQDAATPATTEKQPVKTEAPAKTAAAATEAPNAGNNRSEAYSCANNGLTRTIDVVSDGAEKLPCKVKYAKPDEGEVEPQFLWSANNDLEYCIDKAAFLADKLTGWGWACSSK